MYLHNYLLSSNINLYLLNVTIVCQINQCTNPRYLPWADVVTNKRDISKHRSTNFVGRVFTLAVGFQGRRWNDDFSSEGLGEIRHRGK